MAEQFNYSSVLAPYIRQLLDIKISVGQYSALRAKWILKEFDDFASTKKLEKPFITENFIKEWRSTRMADCERTLYAKYSIWMQLTKLMSRRGCTCFIPRMPPTPKSNFTPYIFTEEQISQLFSYIDNSRLYDIRLGTALISMPTIFRLLYSTGMRVSEVLSIKNKDIHIDEGYIHLQKTKNGCERIVPLCSSMKSVLADYIEHRNIMPICGLNESDKLLFIKSDGTSICQGAVYQQMRKLLKLCKIPHIGNHNGPRVHDLRHTFAVHALVQMAKNGMDLYTALPILSTCLGHQALVSTEKYVRLTCAMYPELEIQCSEINAFVFPKFCKSYDYND